MTKYTNWTLWFHRKKEFDNFFLSNWCGNLKSNFDILYKAVCKSGYLLRQVLDSGEQTPSTYLPTWNVHSSKIIRLCSGYLAYKSNDYSFTSYLVTSFVKWGPGDFSVGTYYILHKQNACEEDFWSLCTVTFWPFDHRHMGTPS